MIIEIAHSVTIDQLSCTRDHVDSDVLIIVSPNVWNLQMLRIVFIQKTLENQRITAFVIRDSY